MVYLDLACASLLQVIPLPKQLRKTCDYKVGNGGEENKFKAQLNNSHQ